MITVESVKKQGNRLGDYRTFEFRGLSTDTKPTETYGDVNIGNGSVFTEMDTGVKKYYDEANSEWVGGNGGGSMSIATEINSTSTNDDAAGAKAVYDFATGLSPTFTLEGDQTWLSGERVNITDETNVAQIEGFKQAVLDGKKPNFTLSASGYTFNLTQTLLDYEDQEGFLFMSYYGMGVVPSVGLLRFQLDNATSSGDTHIWSIVITPLIS